MPVNEVSASQRSSASHLQGELGPAFLESRRIHLILALDLVGRLSREYDNHPVETLLAEL